jgi:hypothetical protein
VTVGVRRTRRGCWEGSQTTGRRVPCLWATDHHEKPHGETPSGGGMRPPRWEAALPLPCRSTAVGQRGVGRPPCLSPVAPLWWGPNTACQRGGDGDEAARDRTTTAVAKSHICSSPSLHPPSSEFFSLGSLPGGRGEEEKATTLRPTSTAQGSPVAPRAR